MSNPPPIVSAGRYWSPYTPKMRAVQEWFSCGDFLLGDRASVDAVLDGTGCEQLFL